MPADLLDFGTEESRQSIPMHALAEDERQIAQRMERRDRNALLLYGVFGFVVVVIEEVAIFEFDMVERFGIAPILVRGAIFLMLTTALWAALLRVNRRMVRKLMHEKLAGYESVLLAYDNALGLKDAYTGGHGRRVASYAHAIAGALGLPHEQVNSVREAASLHDIGKIGIPDAILTKPGKLTAEEFDIIKQHPALGAGIVESIPLLARHAPAVRHHHERFDGSGYPDGLRGSDIPLAARIIAVADAFDAMSSNRSYRSGVSADRALNEITKDAGSHFDPRVVAAINRNPARDALFAAHGEMT
ncbi:MAG: HD-GYP domain-containing protein [Sideroxyarcus sp.]|nr:HD-GYP domain-containing protein [Sideroxyarcus sp.]